MREDLTGHNFGHLKVIAPTSDEITPKGTKIAKWECLCDCGAKVITRGSSLKSGHTKGCGQKHRVIKDMTGLIFADLTVLERAEDYITAKGTRHIRWLRQCKCGRKTIVRGTALRYGGTKSCGHCSRSKSNMGKNQKDLSGLQFGNWTVFYQNGRLTEPSGRIVPLWHCKCACGEERDIRAGTLVQGESLSCGCYKHKKLSELSKAGFSISKAERIVNDWLKSENLCYETQVIDPELRGKSGYVLSFDFLVYRNNDPYLYIECQGKQHYEPVEYFGGVKSFTVQKYNDCLKREYVAKKNLHLLEIPYTCKTKNSIIQLLKSYVQ